MFQTFTLDNSLLGPMSPWTKVFLDQCPLDKVVLGQMCQQRKFGVDTFVQGTVVQKIWVQKFLVKKIFGAKDFKSKKCRSKIIFGRKRFVVQRKCWVQKTIGVKRNFVKKNVVYKNECPKKMGQKSFVNIHFCGHPHFVGILGGLE